MPEHGGRILTLSLNSDVSVVLGERLALGALASLLANSGPARRAGINLLL